MQNITGYKNVDTTRKPSRKGASQCYLGSNTEEKWYQEDQNNLSGILLDQKNKKRVRNIIWPNGK